MDLFGIGWIHIKDATCKPNGICSCISALFQMYSVISEILFIHNVTKCSCSFHAVVPPFQPINEYSAWSRCNASEPWATILIFRSIFFYKTTTACNKKWKACATRFPRKLFGPLMCATRCLKITEKVSFNIASEASYVYID